MTDFFNVLSREEAVQFLETMPVLSKTQEHLSNLINRVLAEDIFSKENLPYNSRSAMDGYAVIASDTFGASENNPAFLNLAFNCPVNSKVMGQLSQGQCASVVTGSPIPLACDAVLMHEFTQSLTSQSIEAFKSVAPGENIMLEAEDYKSGEKALEKGQKLRPQEIGLLAALGYKEVKVYKKAQVAILSTGDEIIAPDQDLDFGLVRDVNSYTLQAIVQKTRAQSKLYGIVADNLDLLKEKINLMLSDDSDLILLSGGSSVGMRDLTISALNSIPETQVICHGLAINPGKPVIIAKHKNKIIFGLPGQVSSSQVVMQVLVSPFIWHLQGLSQAFDQNNYIQIPAKLSRNLASKPGREDYVRVKLHKNSDQSFTAIPILALSGLMRNLIEADGIIKIPASLEGLEANSQVNVFIF